MILVADASVITSAIADFGPAGDSIRDRLIAADATLHVIRNVTDLEVTNAISILHANGHVTDGIASQSLRTLSQFPVVRHDVTQSMRTRIWELKADLTTYHAAYVALVERLQSELRQEVRLATADLVLAATPGLMIEFEDFYFDEG